MSHDRGCPCGKEKYEYDDCTRRDCPQKRRDAPRVYPIGPRKIECQSGLLTEESRAYNLKMDRPVKCKNRAKYNVGGKLYCAKHAGCYLLRELTK